MLLLLTSFGMVRAQEGRIKFTEYDLPNGLHVILHQDNSTPIVAVTILYHVGSKMKWSVVPVLLISLNT
jgi:predicted Zn-dependent peptidase